MPYTPPPKPPRRWDEAFTHLYLVPEHTNGLSQRIKGPAGAGPASVPPPRQGFYDILLPPKFLPCRSRTPGSLRPVPLPPLSWFVLDYLLCRVQHVPTCTKSASVPFRASPTQSRPMPHLFHPLPMPLLRLPVPRLLIPRVLRLWRSIPPTTAPVHLPVPRLPVLWCMATTLLPMPVPRRPVSRLRCPRSSPPSPDLEGAATAPRRGTGSLFGRSMPLPCRQMN